MPSFMQRLRSASASLRAPSAVRERGDGAAFTPEGDMYTVQVIAFGETFAVPVSKATPVPVVLRQVMEAAISEEQAAALGTVEGTLFHGEKPLTLDTMMGSVPRKAVLHLHTSATTMSAVVRDLQHGAVAMLPPARQRSSVNTITMQPCLRSELCGAEDSPSPRRVSAESAGLSRTGTPDHEGQEAASAVHHTSFFGPGFSYPDLGARSAATLTGSVAGVPDAPAMLWPRSMLPPGSVPEAPYYYFVPHHLGSASGPAGMPLRLHALPSRTTTASSSFAASRRRESAVELANSLRLQPTSVTAPLSTAALTGVAEATSSPPPSPPHRKADAEPPRLAKSNDRYVIVYLRLPREKAAAHMATAALNADRGIIVEHVAADEVSAEGLLDMTTSTVASATNSRVGPAAYAYRRLRVERDFPVGTLRELCAVDPRFRLLLAHAEVTDETKTFRELRVAPNAVFYFSKDTSPSPDVSGTTQPEALTRSRLRQHLDATRESAVCTVAGRRIDSQVGSATATATAGPLLSATEPSKPGLKERPTNELASSPVLSTLSIKERISAFNDGTVQGSGHPDDATAADADAVLVATSADRYVVEGRELTLTSAVAAEEARRQAASAARAKVAEEEAAAAATGVDVDCCLPEERAQEKPSAAKKKKQHRKSDAKAGAAAADKEEATPPPPPTGSKTTYPSTSSAGGRSPVRLDRLKTSPRDASEGSEPRHRPAHHRRAVPQPRHSPDATPRASTPPTTTTTTTAASTKATTAAANALHAKEAPAPAKAATSTPTKRSHTEKARQTAVKQTAAPTPAEMEVVERRASPVAKLRRTHGISREDSRLTPVASPLHAELVSEGTAHTAVVVNPLTAHAEAAPAPAAAAHPLKTTKPPHAAAQDGNTSAPLSRTNSTGLVRRGSAALLAPLRRLMSPKSRPDAAEKASTASAAATAAPTADATRLTSSPPSSNVTTTTADNAAAASPSSEKVARAQPRASQRRKSSGSSSGTSAKSTVTALRPVKPPTGHKSAPSRSSSSPRELSSQPVSPGRILKPATASAAPAASEQALAAKEGKQEEEAPASISRRASAQLARSPSYTERQRRGSGSGGVALMPIAFLGSTSQPPVPLGPEVSMTLGPVALSSTQAPSDNIPNPGNPLMPVSILVSPSRQPDRQARVADSGPSIHTRSSSQSDFPSMPTTTRSPPCRAPGSPIQIYSVESQSTANRRRITICDPRDPTRFHYGVPVDPDCPVGELRKWVVAMQWRGAPSGSEKPDLADARRYGIFAGDVHLPMADQVTFAEVTCGRNDIIFSIRPI